MDQVSTHLNPEPEEKLQEEGWLISTILFKFKPLTWDGAGGELGSVCVIWRTAGLKTSVRPMHEPFSSVSFRNLVFWPATGNGPVTQDFFILGYLG